MPERSLSCCCRFSRYSLLWRATLLRSSSSASTPFAIISPFPKREAGSAIICSPIILLRFSKVSIPSARVASSSTPSSRARLFRGPIMESPLKSCITSLGIIFPAAALATIRSKSPTCETSSLTASLFCSKSAKYCTTPCLLSISSLLFRGIASQLLSSRPPCGERLLSITCSRVVPSLPAAEEKISRFLKVKLSIHTKLSLSIRFNEQICATPALKLLSR